MLDFFIALFGGLYYGTKYCNYKMDKAQSRASNEAFFSIQRTVTAGNKEYGDAFYPTSIDAAQEMIENISNELEYVFGKEKWRDLYNRYKFTPYSLKKAPGNNGFWSIWNMAREIRLSKYGFIPSSRDAYDLKFYFPEAEREKLNVREINYRACQIIERNIREKHPSLDLKLYYVDATCLKWNYQIDSYRGTYLGRPW